jgi:magnesium-transporting ATPase (P-type)
MQHTLSTHWHHLAVQEVVEILGTDAEQGLDVLDLANRQARFGPNVLTRKTGHGPVVRFLLQFHQPLVYILLAAALVTALLQEWVDAAVIFGVVLVNAVVGFLQESKAVTAIEALAKSLSSEATVVRGGRRSRMSAVELVPGDVVLLRSGDRVPVDLRLIRTRDLQIDESALTGESVPVEKHTQVLEHSTPLVERRNLAFSSTLVTYGTGTGVVVAIGDATQIGQISEMIASAQVLDTPLTRKIKQFSHVLLVVILALAAVTFTMGALRGQPWFTTFMAAVALAVAAIPEGLPAAVTIILAIGVARMARRRAIIRRLPAVETLGSTTVICSDKTGTLTQNQMTVQEILADKDRYTVSGVGYAPTGAITQADTPLDPATQRALYECLVAGALCNDAALVHSNGQWQVQGDPTEGALLVSAYKGGLDPEEIQKTLPRLDTLPFESQHQYMATLHNAGLDKPRVAYLKGSFESLLPRCLAALDAAGNPRELASIEAAVEEGRGVYDNLLKFIVWTLPTNGGEALVILLAVLLGSALPILPVQLLWINMTTAVCLGMMLAFEPKERHLMERPPRQANAPILSGALVERLVLVSALLCAGAFGLYSWELAHGASVAQAQTVAVTVFVIGELCYLFNCRSLTHSMFGVGVFSNPWLWAGVTMMVLLQLLFVYTPVMNRLFHTVAMGGDAWARIIAVGVLLYTIVGIEKGLRRCLAHSTGRPQK